MEKRIIAVFVILILTLLSCGKEEYQVEIRYEGDLKYIINPEAPKFQDPGYEFDPVLTIGLEDGDDNYLFSRIRDVKVDEQGNIYILDQRNYRIQVFNENGEYSLTIGKKGQGPGEFMMCLSIDLDDEGRIYAMNYRPARILCFKKDGTYERDISLGTPMLMEIFHRNGKFIVALTEFRENMVPDKSTFIINMHSVDLQGNLIYKIGPYDNVKSRRIDKSLISLWTDPDTKWTVDQNGRVYIGYSDKYEIDVYDTEGKLNFKIIRKCKPTELTERDIREDLEGLAEAMRPKVKMPEFKPYFYYMVTDEEDNLWVQRYGRDDNDNYEFDIFNSEGIYLRYLKLPVKPEYFKNGFMYAITETEGGFPSVTKYKIVKLKSEE